MATKSWEVSDEFWGRVSALIPKAKRDPEKSYLFEYDEDFTECEITTQADPEIVIYDLELNEDGLKTDFVNLYATTPTGQQIKSSTFHMIGEDYNLALGINFDYSSLIYANRILVDLMSADADLKSAMWHSGDNRLGEIFDECLTAVGKPISALNKADRLKIIALLNQRDAFSFRKSVPFISQRLGVSRYTIYKYLSELAEGSSAED